MLITLCGAGCHEVHRDPEGTGGTTLAGPGDDDGAGAGMADSSSSTGEPPPLCEQFCEATGSCFQDCAAVCAAAQEPSCAAEGEAYAACLVEHYDAATCTAGTNVCSCYGQMKALLECQALAGCEPEVCAGSETTCTCSRQCPFGEVKAHCTFSDGQAFCRCGLNDGPCLTSTISATGMQACSLEGGGACQSYFDGSP